MNEICKKFIGLFFLIIIISLFVHISVAQINYTNNTNQENETVGNNNNAISKSQTSDIDLLIESNRNFDRSLVILDKVINAIGVLVALLTLIIIFVGGLGFFEINRWRKTIDEIKNDADTIKDIRQKAENHLVTMRNEIKSENLPVSGKPSEKILKSLDEFDSRLELLEVLGATLESEDYYNRGYNLSNKGEYKLSLKAFEKTIELDPKDVDAWIMKAIVLSELGRHKEAINANKKAIELDPTDAIIWSNYSASLLDIGKLEEGLKAANKAIELDSNYVRGWYNRACYYSKKSQKQNALSDLEKAIEINESYKDIAKTDTDFEKYWDDGDFKSLVNQDV